MGIKAVKGRFSARLYPGPILRRQGRTGAQSFELNNNRWKQNWEQTLGGSRLSFITHKIHLRKELIKRHFSMGRLGVRDICV